MSMGDNGFNCPIPSLNQNTELVENVCDETGENYYYTELIIGRSHRFNHRKSFIW